MIMKLQGVIRLIAVCPLLLSLGMPIAYGQPVADKPGLQENPYQEFSLGAIKPPDGSKKCSFAKKRDCLAT